MFRVKSNPDMHPIAFCVFNVKKKNWRRLGTEMSEGDMAMDRGKFLCKHSPGYTRIAAFENRPQI